MARVWASVTALLSLLLVPGATAGDVALYGIDGVVGHDIYQGINISSPVYANFDFRKVQDLSLQLAATQGVVIQAAEVPDTIVLRLPTPNNDAGETTELVGRYHYLGPEDPRDPASSLLSMFGVVEGAPTAQASGGGELAADLLFFMHIDPQAQWVEGGVVIGQTFFKFETIDGTVVITAFPVEEGLCRLEPQAHSDPVQLPPVVPPPGTSPKDMTKAERRAYRQQQRQQRKQARAAKRAANKAARLAKRQGGKRRVQEDAAQDNEHAHDEHAHDGHEHDGHFHDPAAMHRQLQGGRLLVFVDVAPPSGAYGAWGSNIVITPCDSTVVSALPRLLAAMQEDFAPFNVEFTTSRATYNAAPGRRVAVNLVSTAKGVIADGGACGVAYLNSLGWAKNWVWASCQCGLSALAQVMSHEVGHIFNLKHDGTPNGPYLYGLPNDGSLTAGRRWNAIMGGASNVGLEQWSNGSYPNANNFQDDMAIITSLVGPRVSRPDAPAECNTAFAYRDLTAVVSNVFTTFPTAIITCPLGTHLYPIRIRNRYELIMTPPANGNMKARVSIVPAVQSSSGQWVPASNAQFTTLGQNDAYSSSEVRFVSTSAVPAGNYLVRVAAMAEPGNANTYPFPAYGSVGSYTMKIRNGFL